MALTPFLSVRSIITLPPPARKPPSAKYRPVVSPVWGQKIHRLLTLSAHIKVDETGGKV
jgi:hypothetical protein